MMSLASIRRARLTLVAVALFATALIFLLLIENASDLDLSLTDLMYDPVSRSFPWRRSLLVTRLGHDILRAGLIAIGIVPNTLVLYDLVRPIPSWSEWFRARLRVVALSALTVPLCVNILKFMSATYCPWDLMRYGGAAPYVRLLEPAIAGWTSGRCLPGAHASGALWMISIAIFWWPHRPRKAFSIGVTMLAVGFVVGWIQLMRGAHFLSHTLWSMWIACVVVFTLFVFLTQKGRARLHHQ